MLAIPIQEITNETDYNKQNYFTNNSIRFLWISSEHYYLNKKKNLPISF